MPSPTFTAWGGVTDPKLHNPEDYRYLVHMDSGFDTYLDGRKYFIDNIGAINEPLGTGHQNSRKRNPVICASLVSNHVNPLFFHSTHGLIIEVPAESVIATNATDIFIDDEDLDKLAKQPLHEPDTLLAETSPFTNNEVVLEPSRISVTGILYLGSARYRYHNYNRCLASLSVVAEIHSLPVITI